MKKKITFSAVRSAAYAVNLVDICPSNIRPTKLLLKDLLDNLDCGKIFDTYSAYVLKDRFCAKIFSWQFFYTGHVQKFPF